MDDCTDNIWTAPIPLFPLPNCVLLPGAVLPLHVFEPRYRRLAIDALEHTPQRRAIAIALLREGYDDLYLTNHAPIHPVVGVGTILEHQQLADGRFNLLVQGVARASVHVEDASGAYRKAVLVPRESTPLVDDETNYAARQVLCALLTEAANRNLWPAEAVEGFFEAFPSTEQLIDVLAFHLIPADETILKQQILEEREVAKRMCRVRDWLKRTIATQRYTLQPPFKTGAWPPPCSPN